MSASVEIVGPLRHHAVIIGGREVPHLTAGLRSGGMVELVLDNRISIDIPVADLDRLAKFIADGIAIGMGYCGHPDSGDPVVRPPFPRWTDLTGLVEPEAQDEH